MKKLYTAAAALTVLAMAATPVLAQDVTISGEPCPLTVRYSREEGAESEVREFPAFRLYGRAGSSYVLVRTDGGNEYLLIDEVKEKLPDINIDAFPNVDDLSTFGQGTNGEEAVRLQNALIKLGYLEGTADGDYGAGTVAAVQRFQAAHGLEETGEASAYMQMLLYAAADGIPEQLTVTYPHVASAEEKFAAIASSTEVDLSPYASWAFSYDAFEESGVLDPGLSLGSFSIDSPDMDRISGTLSLKVVLVKNAKKGIVELKPSLVLETAGAYRPYLQGAAILGSDTVQLKSGKSTGEIDGVTVKEFGYVPLTADALELLSGGSVTQIRMRGKNRNYDIDVAADGGKLAAFKDAVAALYA